MIIFKLTRHSGKSSDICVSKRMNIFLKLLSLSPVKQVLHHVRVALWEHTNQTVAMEHARLVLEDLSAPHLLQNPLNVVQENTGR